jgi:peptidase E
VRLLLGSGGFRTDERLRNLRSYLVAHLGRIDTILFIPDACKTRLVNSSVAKFT